MNAFFKNAQVYKLADSFAGSNDRLSPVTLSEKMEEHEFGACLEQQAVSMGWVPAIPGTENKVHANGDNWLICLKRQERILPGPVIQKALTEKVDQIQNAEDRRVGSKERRTLKDEVIFSMLPKAFTKDSLHYAYINLRLGLMVVDSASESMSDTVTSFLRETIGSLPCSLLQSHCQPAQSLTNWLKEPSLIATNWKLIPKLKMTQSSNSDVKVSFVNVELDSEEIKVALEHDGQVMEIDIEWKERLSACINSKAQIKRIKFSDLVTEQAFNDGGDDRAAQFDASFMLMATDINCLIVEMVALFGLEQS